MFICSTKTFKVRCADESILIIPKGFVGEIPDKAAKEWIIQEAIKDGSISTPASKKDNAIDKAIVESEEKAVEIQKEKEDLKAIEESAVEEKPVEVTKKPQKAKEKKSK